MPRPTYEEDARLIEDVVTYLGCSRCGLPRDTLVYFSGYLRSADAVTAALRAHGLRGDDLNAAALLPRRPSYLIWAPEKADDLVDLTVVSRMGLLERRRLAAWGLIPADGILCRAERISIPNLGEPLTERTYYLSHGGRWFPVGSHNYGRERIEMRYTRTHWVEHAVCTARFVSVPVFACIAAWARVNEWSVEFRLPGAPGLWVTSDALGARELLRLRDLAEGKSRRDALKHWVREHWRRGRRHDPEAEIQVKQHLRGQDTCTWFGLDCRIVPSQSDLELASPPSAPEGVIR